jgi:hypothetical protein
VVVLSIVCFGLAVVGEKSTTVVKVVQVRTPCDCGGEAKYITVNCFATGRVFYADALVSASNKSWTAADVPTNIIRQLVSEGRVCEVVGHKWKYRDGYTFADDTKSWLSLTPMRDCMLCKKTEHEVTEWK